MQPSRASSASTPPQPRASRGVKIVIAMLLAVVAMVTGLAYAVLRLLHPG